MSALLNSLVRLAYAKPSARAKLLPLLHKHAVSGDIRLEKPLQQKINVKLSRVGLDGNGRYRSIGMALSAASTVLEDFGIEPDDVFSANRFREDTGHTSFYLAFSNAEDAFSPVGPISNSMLAIQWTKLDEGRYEVIAYLS